jgi:hypothetical protein
MRAGSRWPRIILYHVDGCPVFAEPGRHRPADVVQSDAVNPSGLRKLRHALVGLAHEGVEPDDAAGLLIPAEGYALPICRGGEEVRTRGGPRLRT